MRIVLTVVATLILLALGAAAAALGWNEPEIPPPMPSLANTLDRLDFGDLPAKQTYAARDGTPLVFRSYPGDENSTVVLFHGATGTSASMHGVARELHARGATVFALAARGHDGSGRSGDVDYIGQINDDLEDFMKTIGARREGETRVLLGFSAGGGFVLRFAGDARAKLFDRFVLVSPGLVPLFRPNGGGLASPAVPRLIVLQGLSRLGIDAFDHLPVIAFGVSAEPRYGLTRVWTFRMLRSFSARPEFLEDVRRAPGPVIILAGASDEVLFTDKYDALLRPARPDIDITLLPGFNHTDMVTKPEALQAIADKMLGSTQ